MLEESSKFELGWFTKIIITQRKAWLILNKKSIRDMIKQLVDSPERIDAVEQY